ncbi:MAG TPA: hypothetical protein VJR89_26540 [Polyangiales bacterium]|nr:hypothetical protein [Polyangiales bacterium]
MRRFLICCCVLGAVACASSSATTPSPEHPEAANAPPAPPPPPIPQDPLELVSADIALLVNARVEVMKDKDAFQTLRRTVLRYGCVSEADFDWLAGQTQRALFVNRGDAERPELVVILAGQFGDADAARALEALSRGAHAGDATASRTQGRFAIAQKGPWSAIVLENRLLIAGHDGFVGSTLDLIEHPEAPRFAQTPQFAELGGKIDCMDRSVCGLVTPNGGVAKRMKGELSGVGMKKVGRELAGSQSGFTIAVGEGLVLRVTAHLQSDADADGLAKDTKDWLWQAGLVARLAGFPDVLGDADVKTEGSFTELKIQVGEGDLAKLEKRFEQMLGDEAAARCRDGLAFRSSGTSTLAMVP